MDIYMNRQEFLLKFHPKNPKNGGMLPLNHPELFITDKIQVHRYPENFQQQVPSQVSFRSELLVTNEAHDGIWLFNDDEHECTSFLGGTITPEDWEYSYKNPYYVMFSTLIRNMIEAHPICKHSMGINPFLQMSVEPTLNEFKDVLYYLLRQFDFEVNASKPMLNFYQYWLTPIGYQEKQCLDSMRLYTLVEVTHPVSKIAALSDYRHREFVWYSRKDHMYNLSTKTNRASLFQSDYQNDLRTMDSGLDILNDIFRNESIFGKLNIY